MIIYQYVTTSQVQKFLAARLGIEPKFAAPKAAVLPLDDLAIDTMAYQSRYYSS